MGPIGCPETSVKNCLYSLQICQKNAVLNFLLKRTRRISRKSLQWKNKLFYADGRTERQQTDLTEIHSRSSRFCENRLQVTQCWITVPNFTMSTTHINSLQHLSVPEEYLFPKFRKSVAEPTNRQSYSCCSSCNTIRTKLNFTTGDSFCWTGC